MDLELRLKEPFTFYISFLLGMFKCLPAGKKEGTSDFETLPAFPGKERLRPGASGTTTTTVMPRIDDTNDVHERPLPPLAPGKPDMCDTSYDAVAVIREELYIFRGPVGILFLTVQIQSIRSVMN